MDAELVPAHVLFAKWFIRIRWIALFTLIISTYVVKNIFKVSIQDIPIYYLSFILFGFNCFHIFILKVILLKELSSVIIRIKWDIHFQIITDLVILTLILHFSGGIENPMIIFFFLHMIIASSIFSTFGSYLHTTFAFVLVAMLAFFECYSIIPHCHLEGFINPDLYQNNFFIYGSGFIFITTSLLLVHLTHLIVSRSIKIEENYVKTNDELEKKDKLKNEYVLRVTHDIKGHLAAILSCLQVMRSTIIGSLNDKQEEFVNRAFERTELLTDFVKDLLNLTKKRLKQDTEFEQFLLKDLIAKVVSSVQILAKDKLIEFTVFIDNNIRTITGDPFTIEELYSNLLLNAIKYTPPKGRIELSVRNRYDHIVSEISDSGIGIPKEDIPKIFDEFYRASNIPKDIRTGSGLGLSIVKQIVENHKGRIWVNSEVGVSTKFTFTLPKNPNFIE